MKHLRGVHANSLTARLPSFDGNKSLCFLESKHDTERSNFSTFQALSAINHRRRMSPHPLPPCSPSSNPPQRRMAISSSWQSQPWLTLKTPWDREMMQKEQENPGVPMPLLHSLAPLPMLMRVAELYFLTTATQCGSGWQSLCLQPDAVQSPSRGVGCSVMWLFFCLMASWWC